MTAELINPGEDKKQLESQLVIFWLNIRLKVR